MYRYKVIAPGFHDKYYSPDGRNRVLVSKTPLHGKRVRKNKDGTETEYDYMPSWLRLIDAKQAQKIVESTPVNVTQLTGPKRHDSIKDVVFEDPHAVVEDDVTDQSEDFTGDFSDDEPDIETL